MALKTTLSSLDEVPDELRAHYKLKDGEYVLDIDGDPEGYVPSARLIEFRTNNRKLNSQIEQAAEELEKAQKRLESFKDIDPEEYVKLKARVAELEKVGAGAPDDVKALLKRATEALAEKLNARINELESRDKARDKELADAKLAAARSRMENDIRAEAEKAGVTPPAMADILWRAGQVFWVDPDTGAYEAKAADGTPIYGSKGDPLQPREWLKAQVKEAPHLFKTTHGGGSDDRAGEGLNKTVPAGTYDPNLFSGNSTGAISSDVLRKIASGELRPADGGG